MSHTQGKALKRKRLTKQERIELSFSEWEQATNKDRLEWNRLHSIKRHRMRCEDYTWMELFK